MEILWVFPTPKEQTKHLSVSVVKLVTWAVYRGNDDIVTMKYRWWVQKEILI